MTRLTLAMMLSVALLAGCERAALQARAHDDHAAHGDRAEEHEAPRGPHGGRLLTDGEFTIELALVEGGGRAELRAWARHGSRPIAPSDVDLVVELHRLGGRVDRVGFAPQGEFLRGESAIAEPHSFDVRVTASFRGDTHVWEYASYEGRTTIPVDVAREAGIETDIAGPGTLVETLTLYGTIVPDATRVREVKARFPGVIRSVAHKVGDTVRAGETLATVEANESLRTYAITAPIEGVVTERHAEPGEQTGDAPLFEIVDFSRVWAELKVFARDRARLRTGQRVAITAEGTPAAAAQGTIDYIAPVGDPGSQSVTARVVLDNRSGAWTPGQFVTARVEVATTRVALAVPLSALQTFRDFAVVYAQAGDVYEVRMVELGRRDAERAEVLGGLEPGTRYVTRNSYLIKADIEKAGASHEH